MKKKSIIKKIDTMYTKVVKVIIGDLPLQELKPKNYDTSKTKENVEQAKYIYNSLKDKFLNLGVPKNEKELLYKEVAKREKKEVEEVKEEVTKTVTKQVPKTEEIKKETSKKKTIATSKKSTTQSSSTNPSNSKPTTKKTSTQNKEEDTKVIGSVVQNSTKTTPTKKTKTIPTKSNTKKEAKKEKVAKEKKTNIKKATTTISTDKTTLKTKSAPRGAKKAAKIALYIKDIKKHYGEVDEDFVAIIVKNLGPSIYKKDAELVSCSDPKELDTVLKNFLKKKLGIAASKGVLDAAIQDVCIELKGARKKYRATFYYALAKKFKKESVLS